MTSCLEDYLAAASEAARLGARELQSWRRRFQVQEKARFDLVTDADLASQRAIREFLARRFPEHDFLGEEEQSFTGRPGPDAPPTWIVDPLDGTTNYVHDCPLYCVSIGLQVAGELVVGVVFDPCAGRDVRRGPWPRGPAQWPASADQPNGSAGRNPALDRLPARCARTANARSIGGAISRCTPDRFAARGSTALNLAYVAAGRFDGYWAFDNHVWDVAAGAVLVAEAGGRITNVDGSPYDPYRPDALASNGPLHSAMLAAFRDGP